MAPSQSSTFGEDFYGREVSVRVDPPDMDPGIGQFRITLMVDGKERFTALYTDRSDEEREA